jgi:hypothetical protein
MDVDGGFDGGFDVGFNVGFNSRFDGGFNGGFDGQCHLAVLGINLSKAFDSSDERLSWLLAELSAERV